MLDLLLARSSRAAACARRPLSSRAPRSGVSAFVAAAAAAGCVADEPTVDSHVAAITNGVPDDGDPAVGALFAGGDVFCTATLIAPDVVITAAHCMGPEPLAVMFGPSIGSPVSRRAIVHQRAHPVHDLAVMRLSIPAPDDIVPVAVRDEPLPPSAIGAPLRLVGFGLTSTGGDGELGVKHVGTSVLDVLDDFAFEFGPAPSQTCLGDSGGPAFMVLDGVEVLVGVTSSGDARCEEYARDTRVDPFVDELIRPYAEGLATPTAGCNASGDALPLPLMLVLIGIAIGHRRPSSGSACPTSDPFHGCADTSSCTRMCTSCEQCRRKAAR